MGLMDNIRGFFSGSKNNKTVQVDDEYAKSRLAEKIIDLVNEIKRINSLDSSIWNLSNVSSYELSRRNSLSELQRINSVLENRLLQLNKQRQTRSPERESLEASKWTGQKPKNMSELDFDRFQRSDDGCR